MNIKSAEARHLADELSKLTGNSVTQVVTTALRDMLDSERKKRNREGLAERLMEIGRRAAARPPLDSREPDDILYDEFGLPK
jgi:antitoxin VapB